MHVLAKRGKSIRQIAGELGRSPTTIARVLPEPVATPPSPRRRTSKAAPDRTRIVRWIHDGLPVVRMLELARADPEQPDTGGHTVFGNLMRGIRKEHAQQQSRSGSKDCRPRICRSTGVRSAVFPLPSATRHARLPGRSAQGQSLELGPLYDRHAPGDPRSRVG